MLATTTAEYYDERIGWIREAAGDRFADLELQVLTFLVQIVPDREDATERLAGMMGVSVAEQWTGLPSPSSEPSSRSSSAWWSAGSASGSRTW